MHEHFTSPGTIICANVSFTFVDLTLANILQDGSTILRCKVLNLAPSIFSIPRLLPTSEIYSALVAVWDIFCFYIARYHIKQVTSYCVLVQRIFEQKCQEPRYSSIAQSLDIHEEHFRNHMLYARHQIWTALTQPSSRNCNVHIHAVAFDLSSIYATLSSHCTHSVAPALRHAHAAAALPQHPEDVMRKKLRIHEIEKQWGSALRFETVAVTYAIL